MMIQLNELDIWKELNSPYGNSNEIPNLILELYKTNSTEIADTIIWEYIYHQGTIYENTLATVPHLLDVSKNTDNNNLKINVLLSLGIVLVGIDKSTNLEEIFKSNGLNEKAKSRIKSSFKVSLDDFKNLVNDFFSNTVVLDESSKRYFLIAYLVTITKHKEAEIFKTFSENDEYIFVCPNCKKETFLWNEENILIAYDCDPIFNKDKKNIPINLSEFHADLEWLEKPINRIKINSLKPLIPYFKGSLNCHNCKKKTNIFDGIMNSI